MPYKAVLFDMDGVLIDSFEAWFKTYNLGREHFNLEPISKEEFRKNCWAVAVDILVPKYFAGQEPKEVSRVFSEIFAKQFDYIELLPNVAETIKSIKLPKAIVTNTYSRIAKDIMKVKGLADVFDVIIGGDNVAKGKPNPEILKKALEVLNLKNDEVLFVGDMPIDIDTGKAANVFTVGYKVDGGDKRIEDIKELLEIC